MLSTSGDYSRTQRSLVSEMKMDKQGEDGWSYWSTTDGETQAMFESGLIALGSSDEIKKVTFKRGDQIPVSLRPLADSDAPIATIGRDTTTGPGLIEILGGDAINKQVATYFTETRFTKTGMDRRTVSDFGLVGTIIAELARD